eukprot:scaffold45192_cov43-Tisochrysis_lutea.AAC.1
MQNAKCCGREMKHARKITGRGGRCGPPSREKTEPTHRWQTSSSHPNPPLENEVHSFVLGVL